MSDGIDCVQAAAPEEGEGPAAKAVRDLELQVAAAAEEATAGTTDDMAAHRPETSR